MINLTPAADKAIKRFLRGAENPVAGLRIFVSAGKGSRGSISQTRRASSFPTFCGGSLSYSSGVAFAIWRSPLGAVGAKKICFSSDGLVTGWLNTTLMTGDDAPRHVWKL